MTIESGTNRCPICGTPKEFGCECKKNYSESFLELLDRVGTKKLLKGSHVEMSFDSWEKGRMPIALAIDKDGSILDIGCANGFLLRCLQEWSDKKLEPYGFDVNEASIVAAQGMFADESPDHFVLSSDQERAAVFPKTFDFIFWNVWDNSDFDKEHVQGILSKALQSVDQGGRLIFGFYHPDQKENERRAQQLRNQGIELHEMPHDAKGDERFYYVERKELPKYSTPGDEHFAGFGDQTIDVYKLIETKRVDLSLLRDAVADGNNYWHDMNGEWLGPHQIIEAAGSYQGKPDWDEMIAKYPAWKDEIKKIQKADYNTYPIIVIDNVVVDGVHRLTKAFCDGVQEIDVKHFEELPVETVVTSLVDADDNVSK